MKTKRARLRVDNVPWHLKLPFLAFGHGAGLLAYAATRLIRKTCNVRIEGELPSEAQPTVYCIWHENLAPLFVAFPRLSKQVWMNHPAWYMLPIHVMLRHYGVKDLCLGSTGNGGKQALADVVARIRSGQSTTLAVDGPAGPYHDLKAGAWLMGYEGGAPIVPLSFQCSRAIRLPGWDKKVIPLPFSDITIRVSEPLVAREEAKEADHLWIAERLSA
ncbi:MAG: DUF374 domain-containing protein [Polyangiaceae bacterium]